MQLPLMSLLLPLATVFVLGATEEAALPAKYTNYYVNLQLTFHQAQTFCKVRGHRLVTLLTQEDNAQLYRRLVAQGIDRAWIGLSKQRRASGFTWEGDRTLPVGEFFAKQKPQRHRDQCVVMKVAKKRNETHNWYKRDCEKRNVFFCEFQEPQ